MFIAKFLMNGWTDRWTGRLTDGWMDGRKGKRGLGGGERVGVPAPPNCLGPVEWGSGPVDMQP